MPVVQYLALLIHAQTRKKELIDKLCNLELCISHDRVLQISTELGNAIGAFYKETNNVCLLKFRNGLFTTGCVDNINHNPSLHTAKDSFHGTAITLTQHPKENRSGENCAMTKIDPNIIKQKKLLELPKLYTEIRPIALKVNDFHVPKINGTLSLMITYYLMQWRLSITGWEKSSVLLSILQDLKIARMYPGQLSIFPWSYPTSYHQTNSNKCLVAHVS